MALSSNKRAVLVGIFVLAGLAFLFAGILMVGNLHQTFKKNIQLVSIFTDVNGLEKGSNVWLLGVKIGTVKELHFRGKSEVAVVLNVEVASQRYIKKDAHIKISTDGLIGNKILMVYGGTAAFEEVEDGDTLNVEKILSTEDMINMLQENNQHLLAITTDFKTISSGLVAGEGTIGKLLTSDAIYDHLDAVSVSLLRSSEKANQVIGSLAHFSAGLNREGTLVHDLTTDTVVFQSIAATAVQLRHLADSATLVVSGLKTASQNRNSTVGVLLHDEEAGAQLKATLNTLSRSSQTLEEDLEALQHTFLLRGFFRKKAAEKAGADQQK